MVLDSIWETWPFRNIFSNNSRRHNRQSSRCGGGTKGQSEPLTKLLGPWESKMVALQSILIWENPGRSAFALIFANFVYIWYVTYCEVRIFFGISVFGLIGFLMHYWCNSIWPEISVPKSPSETEDWTPVHPSVLSAPEVSRYLNDIWTYIQGQQKRLAQLRRKQPGWFCVIMVVIFSILWLLGRVISGVTLLYLLLMGVMCVPAFIFHFVPKSFFKKIEQIFEVLFGKKDSSTQNDENDLEDFLPEETSPEVQTALGIPFTTHELKDELSESSKSAKGKSKVKSRRGRSKVNLTSEVGNSFTVGLSESDFPSLEDTTDTLEESDLALPEDVVDARIPPAEVGMNFVSTHFGDSSDDDEEFALGLAFNQNYSQSQTSFRPGGSLFTDEHAQSCISLVGQLISIGSRVSALTEMSSIIPVPTDSPSTDEPTDTIATTDELIDTPADASPAVDTNVGNPEFSDEEDFELISDDDLQ